ncbi:MAG: flagellar biosynthetic protein FliR [Planctomycetia bacterium]|nr:flagellar biosynthetic protein FliR [Planctomycetia bacterium]
MSPTFAQLGVTLDQFLAFIVVLTRMSGLMLAAPVFGSREVPAQIRALLAFTLSLVILPTQWTALVTAPSSLIDLSLLIGGELLIGYTLGLGVMTMFAGVQIGGQIVSQTGGISAADIFNPGFDMSVPIVSQFYYMFALAVFLLIGGHQQVVAALLDTFQSLPPGAATVTDSVVDSVVRLIMQSFSLGVRTAAPATTALLLATLVLGLVGRTLPQLNLMALGFGINAVVMFVLLALGMSALAWLVENELPEVMELVYQALRGMGE